MRSPEQNEALVVSMIIAACVAFTVLLLFVAAKIAFGGSDGV